jgi:hypothetical protein
LAEGEVSFEDILLKIQQGHPPLDVYQKHRLENLEIPSPYILGVFDSLIAANPDIIWNTTIETNRGCPYACTFCDWGSTTYSKVKKFNLERIESELHWIARNPVGFIFGADANFGIFKERDLEIARMMRRILQGSRVDSITMQFAKNSNEHIFEIANELRGYAADKIKEQATKGVGRDINGKPYVSTAELDKQINALDKSGKLDFLFGKQQAERYRTLNEFTKDLQTTPQGTVNTSGTTSTMLAALGEMALTGAATGVPAPVTTIATYGVKKYRANQKMKKVQEYANPGTKISEIPRIEMRGMATKD